MVIDHDNATTISAGIDGGQPWRRTFGDNVVVQGAFDIDLAADTERGWFLGDYIGIDAVGAVAQRTWVDTSEPSRFTDAAGQNDVWAAKLVA